MKYRTLGKTGWKISSIGLGTWQLGGRWGTDFDPKLAERILAIACDHGVNFMDTADVYSAGLSEKAVGNFVKSRSEHIYVATKCGRQISPHTSEGYQPKTLRAYVESSLKNMGTDIIDLIQLHCPPTEVYYRPEIFEEFEKMRDEGKIRHLGVSVEKVEEALKAIEYDLVSTVQIIFNMFRQRPASLFFSEANRRDVGIIVRVPLASGLLTGRYTIDTNFESGDHRFFNREGQAFDKGETFSGIDYQTGLDAVQELKDLFPKVDNLAPLALEWILQYPEVSCIIPGASKPEQVISNLVGLESHQLDDAKRRAIGDIYDQYIRDLVHHRW